MLTDHDYNVNMTGYYALFIKIICRPKKSRDSISLNRLQDGYSVCLSLYRFSDCIQ